MMHYHKILNYPLVVLSVSVDWWLPVIEEMSKYSALLLPIGGLLLVGVQIGLAILAHRRKRGG
jgi:hypothetical protein